MTSPRGSYNSTVEPIEHLKIHINLSGFINRLISSYLSEQHDLISIDILFKIRL